MGLHPTGASARSDLGAEVFAGGVEAIGAAHGLHPAAALGTSVDDFADEAGTSGGGGFAALVTESDDSVGGARVVWSWWFAPFR